MKKDKTLLILMRHGQSEWNEKNIFTGWVDIPLTKKGMEEARLGGEKIADIEIDAIFVSSLMRAQLTAMIAMSEHHSNKTPFVVSREGDINPWSAIHSEEVLKGCIPVYVSSKLNERMYGDLQGCNKDETRAKFGKEQVHIWRRSYDVAPPNGESLEMTAKRTIPYFKKEIIPFLEDGKNIFISAHGNSLRSIVMELENLSKEEVLKLEIPTGQPICYSFNKGKWEKVPWN